MTISPGTPPIADGETALRYLSSESLSGSPFRKDRVMRAGKKIKLFPAIPVDDQRGLRRHPA